MTVSRPRVSLVISTVNRAAELIRLLDSLIDQEFKDFEIIVVDQNCDDRIVSLLKRYERELNIKRVATPTRQGISSGRNDGWCQSRGEVIAFPDDDCWYPSWFLRKGVGLLGATGAELVSGRIADESGRSINGRFATRSQFITRRGVWFAQSEAATLYRRELLEQLGGFDEELGIGGRTPWQAAEGPDLVLKALEHSRICYYDPSLYGFHRKYDLDDPSAGMATRGRLYARGMGYVLRRHQFGFFSLLYWTSRPLFTAFTSTVSGKLHRAAYSLSVSLGRLEGFFGRCWIFGKRLDATEIGGQNAPAGAAAKRLLADHNSASSASFGTKLREMTGPYRARNPLLVGTLYTADVLARLLPKRKQEIAEDRPLRVLVANWGHLGDVVTILPLLKFLEHHPRVQEVGVLVGSWSQTVLEATDIATRIHVFDHWALDRSAQSTFRKIMHYPLRYMLLVRELRRCQYDMSIDTFASFPSSHGIMWSAAIPRRVGFVSGGLGPCLTDPFDWVPDDRLMLDHQLKLLKPLLGEEYPKSLPALYPGFTLAAPPQLLGVGGTPYIVIHMGAANIRGWVPEKWVALAATLKSRGHELVATGGPGAEMEAAHALNKKVPVTDVTGRLSWEQFVATVASATAVVTIDSVAGHIAACFGVPTVALAAGRQRIGLWHPNSSNAVMLTHAVSCAPCNRPNGCGAMACVKLISVEDVLSSLQKVMNVDARVGWRQQARQRRN
jgi:ADP-heptose:LPS heptosyltransferase/glycosyltransferase involved in cell wall biosynthesis